MGKGGGGGTTTVQKSDPWSGVQPYLLGSSQQPGVQQTGVPYIQQQPQGPFAGAQVDPRNMQFFQQGQQQQQLGQGQGAPGIYPEAARLYQQSSFTPEMQNLAQNTFDQLGQQTNQAIQGTQGLGNFLLGGGASFNYSPITGVTEPGLPETVDVLRRVGNIAAPGQAERIAGVDPITGQSVDVAETLAGLGATDPTAAIQQMLTGQANLDTLNPVVENALTRMGQSFSEQFMPQLRSGALSSGQYGSSRQGIAEGLAGDRLAQAMGDVSAGMHNQAYQQAQQLMGQAAGQMSNLGVASAQQNAARQLAADQQNAANLLNTQQFNANLGVGDIERQMQAAMFNANLGLQNNTQALQQAGLNTDLFNRAIDRNIGAQQFNTGLQLQDAERNRAIQQQNLANQAQGLGLLSQVPGMTGQLYGSQQNLLNAPNQFDWDNLMRYASIIQPGAGIGGQTSSTAPDNRNTGAGILGGGMMGAQLAGLMGAGTMGTGLGAGAGALLGLLSDRRFKTDIEPVGQMDNGLTIYRYRYIHGGPVVIGVMADEAKRINPDAVINIDGVDYVRYGEL